jgi:hypothetical protein
MDGVRLSLTEKFITPSLEIVDVIVELVDVITSPLFAPSNITFTFLSLISVPAVAS